MRKKIAAKNKEDISWIRDAWASSSPMFKQLFDLNVKT